MDDRDSATSFFPKVLHETGARWNDFFHRPEQPYALAMLRIAMPLVLLFAALPRWFVSRELYSLDGAPTPMWEFYGTAPLVPVLSAPLAVALFTLLVVCLGMVSIGWMTRTSLAICTVLYPYFGLIDMISTMTKYTVIASHILLLLCFSECGRVWSVDAWLARRQGTIEPPLSSRWPRRLIQILIGVVYLGSAITKLHIPRFLTGEHLTFWMISDLNNPHPLGHWIALQPGFVMATSYVTLLWEVLFLFIAWRGISRWVMLGIGVVFHVMTVLTLGLDVFPSLYIACYLTFLEDHEAQRLGSWMGSRFAGMVRWLPALSWQAPQLGKWAPVAAFGVVLAASTVIGVELEAKLDRFGERRVEGRHRLEPLPPERAAELLRNDLALPAEDTLFSFDVGTTTFGNVLVNRRSRFRPGESILAQSTLVTPHPDAWVEANLHDASNVIVDRRGAVCGREEIRSLFRYDIKPEFEPGTYYLVLKLDGREVARKTIVVSP